MMRDLLRFELRFHARQPSFLAACAFFFGIGFVLSGTGFGPKELAINSPFIVLESFGFVSLFSVFAIAVFASHALLRDTDARMQEIVFTTPVGKFAYLVSRFAGSFAAAAVVLTLAAAGMIAGLFMPWQEAERIAPLDVRTYLYALLVVVLPNLLFINAILFTTASRTRSSLATYVASVFIYVLYFVGAATTNSPLMAASAPGRGSGLVPALLDPFALTAFFYDTRYWTAAQKAARLVPFGGTLLLNRILWIGAALAIWAALYATFSFRILRSKKVRKQRVRPARWPSAVPAHPWAASFVSATRLETRALLRNGATLVLLLLWAGLAATEIGSDVLSAEYFTTLIPETSLILRAISQPLSLIGLIAIIYFSGEAYWRERQARIASIIEATPVRASAMIAAKWVSLCALIGAFTLVGCMTGIAIQLSRGYTNVEPLLYLSLGYFVALPLLLVAAAAILIHALTRWGGKYAGLVLVLLFVVYTQRAQMVGLSHHLWRFGSAPPVSHSSLSGFGNTAAAFHWYMLLWAAVAAAFLVVAARKWRTTREPWPVATLAALGLVAVGAGGWIGYNTTVRNTYTTPRSALDWRAAYEKQYRPIATLPQPEIAAVDTTVDLYPAERRARIAGRDVLVNRTGIAIRSIYVAVPRKAQEVRVSIPAARIGANELATMRFDLATPLPPGGSTQLDYAVVFENRGFTDDEADNSLVPNGSILFSNRAFPSIGYHQGWEIEDPRERKARGLPPPAPQTEEDFSGSRVDYAATLSTSADETAVTSGTLQRTWLKDGRRYFRYRTEGPVVGQFAIASARYARRARGRVEILYDQRHAADVPRMLDVADETLTEMEKRFAPYRERQLHIAETPSTWRIGGLALPGMIFLGEDRAFLIDDRDRDRPDLLFRRVAHEVAHQWFGYQLTPAHAPGGTALIESLTKYAELLMLERSRGKEQVRTLLEMELDRYLKGRADESGKEPPLIEVGDDQAYLFYGKGALVMNATRELIGEEAVNRALRALMATPNPTARGLLAAFREVSTSAQYAQIEEWFTQIVLYDFSLTQARAQRRADGKYDVTLTGAAVKTHGEERVPLHETIEVGVDDAIYPVQLHDGANEIKLVADQAPKVAVIDPRVLRIDRNRGDNAKSF